MIGPANVAGDFTFTQKTADCLSRIDCNYYKFNFIAGDSVALPVTKYYKTPGLKSNVILPFEDFSKTQTGSAFDLVYLKGWVMINFNANFDFEFSNFQVLKCKPTISNSTSVPPSSKDTKSSANSVVIDGALMIAGLLLVL